MPPTQSKDPSIDPTEDYPGKDSKARDYYRLFKNKAKWNAYWGYQNIKQEKDSSQTVKSEAEDLKQTADHKYEHVKAQAMDKLGETDHSKPLTEAAKENAQQKYDEAKTKAWQAKHQVFSYARFYTVLGLTFASVGYFKKWRPVAATFATSSVLLYGHGWYK